MHSFESFVAKNQGSLLCLVTFKIMSVDRL